MYLVTVLQADRREMVKKVVTTVGRFGDYIDIDKIQQSYEQIL